MVLKNIQRDISTVWPVFKMSKQIHIISGLGNYFFSHEMIFR